jgi:hypothetical protein
MLHLSYKRPSKKVGREDYNNKGEIVKVRVREAKNWPLNQNITDWENVRRNFSSHAQ